jgi:hypothetical protein
MKNTETRIRFYNVAVRDAERKPMHSVGLDQDYKAMGTIFNDMVLKTLWKRKA